MKNKIAITEYELTVNIKKPVCFAFVSDLHDYQNEPLFDALKSKKADGILVGGDFIHGTEKSKRGFEFLKKASEIAPTFCVCGNHERVYEGNLAEKIKETGAILLDNRAEFFEGIYICGITSGQVRQTPKNRFAKTPPPNLKALEKMSRLKGFKILLSHHPEYYEKYIRSLSFDLVLSGHAHGGQWRFFGHGVFAPGQGLFPKYTSGIYENRLIVSRGIGNQCGFPRINNTPEFVFLTFK